MPATFSNLMLGSSTVVLCYVTFLIRMMAQHFWMVVAEASRAPHQPLLDTTPDPTSFAIRHYWIFLVLLVSIAGVAGTICRCRPALAGKSLLLGLSSQGFVVWVAMVCYFFGYFLDEMHAYRGRGLIPRDSSLSALGPFP
jgi:hypothetical protein